MALIAFSRRIKPFLSRAMTQLIETQWTSDDILGYIDAEAVTCIITKLEIATQGISVLKQHKNDYHSFVMIKTEYGDLIVTCVMLSVILGSHVKITTEHLKLRSKQNLGISTFPRPSTE